MQIGPKHMALKFLNPSRSFDSVRGRVCFWGYDRAMEITFFAEASIFKEFGIDLDGTEVGFLKAFDATRERIHKIANKVYVGDRSGSTCFTLAEADV